MKILYNQKNLDDGRVVSYHHVQQLETDLTNPTSILVIASYSTLDSLLANSVPEYIYRLPVLNSVLEQNTEFIPTIETNITSIPGWETTTLHQDLSTPIVAQNIPQLEQHNAMLINIGVPTWLINNSE